MMMLTDWVAFLVLDIGTPELEAIPLGTRFAIGLLQAVAVRSHLILLLPITYFTSRIRFAQLVSLP